MGENRRRSRRVVARIPLAVQPVDPPVDAVTAVINLHGALILAPMPYPIGTTLQVTNRESGQTTRGRVVWVAEDASGMHKVGVEFEAVVAEFWGGSYDPEES